MRIELLGTTAPCTSAPKIQEFSSQQCTSSLLCHVILPRQCRMAMSGNAHCAHWDTPLSFYFLLFLLKSIGVAFLKANRNNNLRTYFPPCSQFRGRELWKQFYLSVQDKKRPCIFQLSFLLLALNDVFFFF